MKGSCPSCSKAFSFDESRFGDRPALKVRCPNCQSVVALKNPASRAPAVPVQAASAATEASAAAQVAGEGTSPPAGVPAHHGPPTLKVKRETVELAEGVEEEIPPLPGDRRVSLAILSGDGSGKVIPCERARVVVGRAGSDVPLEDDEISRRHAMLEIHEDRYILRDLGSTNGTFVDERQISEAEIHDRGEFRVGNTQLMLIVTPVDEL